jgi:Raf kinase inhibitor-like YbhB/YbcL family protein
VPVESTALAIVVDDPDAAPGTFTHWVVLDIAPSTTAVGDGIVPTDGVEIHNSGGRTGYFGPCLLSGTHRYRFTVYALRATIGLSSNARLEDALDVIDENSVAWGRLVGTFSAG